MRGFLKVMAAVTILAGPVTAQVNPSGASRTDKGMVYSVTEDDLRALVEVEGHTVDKIHPMDMPSVRGKTKDGLKFLLMGTACDKNGVKGCQGIMMQVRYDSDDAVTVAKINDANINQAAVSTWWDQDNKTVGFTRYVVLDDGVTWLNARRNLRVMLAITKVALKKIWPDG